MNFKFLLNLIKFSANHVLSIKITFINLKEPIEFFLAQADF